MKKILKKIGISLAVVLIILQFFRIDKSVPELNSELDFITITNPPKNIKSILINACYDCHSYQTNYPWYSNIAPISWWLEDHIEEGREHLNFSNWGEYSEKKKNHKLEECWEEIEEGEMPMEEYTYTHNDAKLTEQEKIELIKWLKTIE